MARFLFLVFLSAFAFGEQPSLCVHTFTTTGTICPLHKTTVGSIVCGRVASVFVDVGARVKKGDPLVALETTFYDIALSQAKCALEVAKLELQDSERNFERMKKLFQKPEGAPPSISQKRFEDATLRYDQAVSNLALAEERLKYAKANLNETIIRAPYSGVISKRYIHPGEPVTSAPVTELLEISSDSSPYAEFNLPQSLFPLPKNIPVSIYLDGAPSELHATIDLISPEIDAKTRSAICRAYLNDAPFECKPGALVRVELSIDAASR
jgi:membrane fusion protein, multidrug efflux system